MTPCAGQACPQPGDQMECDLGFVGRDTGHAQTLGCPGVRAHISGHSSQASSAPQVQLWVSWYPPGSSVFPPPAPAGDTLSETLGPFSPEDRQPLGAGSRGPVPPPCLQQPPVSARGATGAQGFHERSPPSFAGPSMAGVPQTVTMDTRSREGSVEVARSGCWSPWG